MYECEKLFSDEPISRGISLFARSGETRSVVVTRGIRVEASSVVAHEMGRVIYSIRLALLSEGEEGGLSRQARGFETAQLRSRHWIITDLDGEQEHVRGDGVVGMYPILRDGGFRNDRQNRRAGHVNVEPSDVDPGSDCEGIFVYQSMSSPSGTFEGELIFVPGSLRQPTGDEFVVRVASFPLHDDGASFIF